MSTKTNKTTAKNVTATATAKNVTATAKNVTATATATAKNVTANDTTKNIEKDIQTVSLYDIKVNILNSISPISFARNNVSTNDDTADTLLDLLLGNKITREEYKARLEKLGKASTRTGDFRAIASLNNERVSSKGILSESLLKGGKNCQGNSPISLAVYKNASHYDAICKLQDILTLLLNIGEDTTTKFDARDFEIALYKAIHVAQSKISQYGINETDTEKAIVNRIKF